jgi:hypothetical protein
MRARARVPRAPGKKAAARESSKTSLGMRVDAGGAKSRTRRNSLAGKSAWITAGDIS